MNSARDTGQRGDIGEIKLCRSLTGDNGFLIANEVIGKAKQQSNDPETRADGVKQEIKGKAQKVKGDVQGALGDRI